ncbi:hypothetical protein NOVOSPHI9U_20176 [Novosphingobium sp. 9U]|nr:hypothetical protein NOVOSPHI9U_20176 [Novosphingobium sp. 9U]
MPRVRSQAADGGRPQQVAPLIVPQENEEVSQLSIKGKQ